MDRRTHGQTQIHETLPQGGGPKILFHILQSTFSHERPHMDKNNIHFDRAGGNPYCRRDFILKIFEINALAPQYYLK